MNKLTESDLDAAIDYRAPARYQHTQPERPPLRLVSPDPMNNVEGPDTEVFERDHAPLRMDGIEVHPMPAEAATEIQGDYRSDWREEFRLAWAVIWRVALVMALVVGCLRAFR